MALRKDETNSSDRLPPTWHKGCATGKGRVNHLYHNEFPCEACRLGSRQYDAHLRLVNKEKLKAYTAEYREKNEEKIRAQIAEYYQQNQSTIKMQHSKYYDQNKDAITRRLVKNKKDRPEISQRARCRRRARLAGAETDGYTEAEVLERYGTDCYLCDDPIDLTAPRRPGIPGWELGLHLEHVIPLSRGGSDVIDNLRPAHGLCNLNKGTSGREAAVLRIKEKRKTTKTGQAKE